MRINSIEIIETKIPLKDPYKLSRKYGVVEFTHPTIVKIYTDNGTVGYGETDAWAGFTSETPETVAAVLKHNIAPAILGEESTNILKLHKIMNFVMRENHMAKAAIDIACYDILGKEAGMPVYHLLGGNLYESLPIMGGIGGETCEEAANAAMKTKTKGYHSLMIKVGRNPVQDAQCVLAVREVVGPDYPLILDANQGWDLASAKKFISIAQEANPVLFEQPLLGEDIEGMAELRRCCDVPVSVDESLTSFECAQNIIRLNAADVFSVKVCKNGGIKESMRIIELARNNGINILFNSMLEEGITQAASLNMALATENIYTYGHAYFSPLRLEADITTFSDLIRDGRVYAPASPGLGISLLEDVLDRYVIARTVIKK
ncbi:MULTISPECIES: mandelate racemase/muconate lactonizing enzyme family protein [Aminobacterium]|nr:MULTISPECIES: enolase C-terminal domain-like protein [unclassified Aminobacterium]